MKKQGLKFFILHTLARQLQSWADFLFEQIGEKERPVQRNQVNAERVDPGSTDADNPPVHWLRRVGAGGPPAHWLRRVQKDAPELLKQQEHSSRNVAMPLHTLSEAQADGSGQMVTQAPAPGGDMGSMDADNPPVHWLRRMQKDAPELPKQKEHSSRNVAMPLHTLSEAQADGGAQTADTGQRVRMAEVMWVEEDSSRLTGIGERQGEEGRMRRDETSVSASPNPVIQHHPVEWIGQGKEPVRTSEPNVHSVSSPGEWPIPAVKPDSSPWEARPVMRSVQQVRHNPWPQAGISTPAHDRRVLDKPGEQIQTEMRWPSLPDEATTDDQDWEKARRLWERQWRLDKEQRGSSWNE